MLQRLLPVLTFSLIALLILFPPLKSAHADSGESDLHATIDGYTVELVFPDGPPKTGPNTVLVRLHAAGDQPLSNATVLVGAVAVQSAGDDEHGHAESGHAGASAGEHGSTADGGDTDHTTTHADHRAAPHADATTDDHGHATGAEHTHTIMSLMEAGADAGTYISVLHFYFAGAGRVLLQFNDAGSEHAGSFAVMVAEPARDWRILGAFGGANALIIVTAGVLKRRLPTTAKRKRVATTSQTED